MVAFKMVERSIGLVSTIILARLLVPEDFGLVAMATAFLGMLLLLTSFSFDVVLIQKQDAERHLYDTAWTFNVIFSLTLSVIVGFSAIPLAEFYDEVRLENILYVFSLSTFFGGFSNIGPVAFRKEMQFHKEFFFSLAKKLISFSVTMILAFTLKSYWALVWGTFAGRFFEVLLSYKVHPYRPRFCLTGRKELFGFSFWLFFNNMIFFAYNRSADFIIGKVLGSHALGVYSISYEVASLPTTELVAPINRAVLPGYSKMSHDLLLIRQGFINVLSVIALCAIPAGVGIALVADSMVVVVLGEKWIETIPLIQMLAISGVFVALQTNVGPLLMAMGRPQYLTFMALFHVFFLFLPMLVFFLDKDGIKGVAESYLYSNLIILPINFFIVSRIIKLKILSILSVLWRPFLSVFLMVGSVMYRPDVMIDDIDMQLVNLFFDIVYGAFVYSVGILFFLWMSKYPEGAEKFVMKKLKVNHYFRAQHD